MRRAGELCVASDFVKHRNYPLSFLLPHMPHLPSTCSILQ